MAEEGIRLNKYLADQGICSRREADRLIASGKVLVDGKTAEIGQKLWPGQTVICQGEKLSVSKEPGSRPAPVWLIVNKPRGIVCTTSHKDRAENILDFLHYPARIYPVGRLDKDSEGLLLMTNEGDLVNKLMRSGNAHEKEYAVWVDRPVTDEFLQKMAAGVWIEELEQKTRPCQVRKTGKYSFAIVLTQGLNRQIRRMCQVFDFQVVRLKRVRIMNIELGDLKTGGWREMSKEEYREMVRILEEKGSTNLPYASRIKPESGKQEVKHGEKNSSNERTD